MAIVAKHHSQNGLERELGLAGFISQSLFASFFFLHFVVIPLCWALKCNSELAASGRSGLFENQTELL